MTDALVDINDRLARAAIAHGAAAVTFFCECGECLADEVPLSLDEYEEIRVREDLIFAPGHDASSQPRPVRISAGSGRRPARVPRPPDRRRLHDRS
jgi:hypothetical protein